MSCALINLFLLPGSQSASLEERKEKCIRELLPLPFSSFLTAFSCLAIFFGGCFLLLLGKFSKGADFQALAIFLWWQIFALLGNFAPSIRVANSVELNFVELLFLWRYEFCGRQNFDFFWEAAIFALVWEILFGGNYCDQRSDFFGQMLDNSESTKFWFFCFS